MGHKQGSAGGGGEREGEGEREGGRGGGRGGERERGSERRGGERDRGENTSPIVPSKLQICLVCLLDWRPKVGSGMAESYGLGAHACAHTHTDTRTHTHAHKETLADFLCGKQKCLAEAPIRSVLRLRA